MKELNRKTFFAIFTIFTVFLFICIAIINIISYKKEYDSLSANLDFMETKLFKERNNRQDMNDFFFMDYDIYTVIVNDNSTRIIDHGVKDGSFDIEDVSETIAVKYNSGTKKIGNLYFSNYAFNYRDNNVLTIINTKSIKDKLIFLLSETIIIFLLGELLIYLASNKITSWIIKPAVDSFNKQKDFIADASHELKTPLAVIMASADEIESSKKNSKYIENIKYESDRMNSLIANMLDLSKLENSNIKETFKEENISKIVEKMCLTLEAVAFEKNVSISTDIDENIFFNSSKQEMEKLVSIVLDNAIKHSYKDSTINVVLKNNKNEIDLSISNNGDPIKEEDSEKIFERFYRVDKARNRSENRYGLGLAIAKAIVTNHGGTIRAFSKDNITTFMCEFKK